MTSPVQLSDLDLAGSADDADLALIRKNNTTDYKVTVQLLRNINIAGLPNLSPTANSPQNTDLLILARGGVNSKCLFPSIGFPVGTKLWFHMNAVPVSTVFWTIVPNTGDTLLAVKGGTTYTIGGGSSQGNWQQNNHTLTVDQIPPHSHKISMDLKSSSQNSENGFVRAGRKHNYEPPASTRLDGGGGQGHNHGNTWRPLASVGIICQKAL